MQNGMPKDWFKFGLGEKYRVGPATLTTDNTVYHFVP